ncbi:hypothetical protein ACSL103130_04900 [Actinomyces slackii]|uniref:DUF11 domain-containing protein n=1 Tax=Actinomyces slackii TaxID=52774 RepID=A0A448KDK8_9ACTO|nr:hypothetical protein [Actinomyces slackii]VEG74982.1 Uncharacterised protein [Actinomyces slackii]
MILTLPLIASPLLGAPAQADTPQPSGDIAASGTYSTAGADCHGTDKATGCLSWGLRVPATAAPNQTTTLTIEIPSQPGQWEWACRDESRVEGTATYYTAPHEGAPIERLTQSGLGFFDHLRYDRHGSSVGYAKSVSCTPERLSLTYEVEFDQAPSGTYLDLSMDAVVVAPGSAERTYSIAPTITTSHDNAVRTPSASVTKPDAAAPQVTVTTAPGTAAPDADSGAGQFVATVRNDSTTALSAFTVSVATTQGPASITGLSCDLRAHGGSELVAPTTGRSVDLSVDSADKTSVPAGGEFTCLVSYSGAVGRNTLTTSVSTGGRSVSSDHQDNRPGQEVTVQAEKSSVSVDPPGGVVSTPHVSIKYTVTVTNPTDAHGSTSEMRLRPQAPNGLTLSSMWASMPRWTFWIDPEEDGTFRIVSADLPANSSQTFSFTAIYAVDTAAIDEQGWASLKTCKAGDPTTGVTTLIDLAPANAGQAPTTMETCTAVERPN